MRKIVASVWMIILFTASIQAKESGFGFSTALVGMSMDYREYGNDGAILDSEKSSFSDMIGSEFTAEYTESYESQNYAQLGIEVLFLSGETQYVGDYLTGGSGYGTVVSTTLNIVLDMSTYLMYTNSFTNGLDLGYGLALGYRSWTRTLSLTQEERYYWFSLRPRIKLSYNFSAFSIGALAEYSYAINPKMSATNVSTDFTLGSADIIKLKIPFTYELNSKIGFFAEYVYEYQSIEKSNVQNGFYEPNSTANNQYAKIGATFKF